MFGLRYACLVSLLCLSPLTRAALHYDLQVDVDVQQHTLQGTVQLRSSTAVTLDLHTAYLTNLQVAGVAQTATARLSLTLQAEVPLTLSYRYAAQADNRIDAEQITLTGLWYPQPDGLAQYQVSALLPTGFIANAEADRIHRTDGPSGWQFAFEFPYPQAALTLVASPHYVRQTAQYREVLLETYFFPSEASLADTYLKAVQKYLALYEALLGPYPYRRFAVVANPAASGWSMPTYTLLGSRLMRLPFILDSSLGHEILHEWFGNAVYADTRQGNWTEGLTTYLADHHYATLKGEGSAYRRQILSDYAAYVRPAEALAIQDFRSRHNKADSVVGYGKTAMLFHMLRQRLGDAAFFAGLKRLLADKTFQYANWTDLRQSFETAGASSLDAWFQTWLTRTDLPKLSVEQPTVRVEQGALRLQFTLKQANTPPYALDIPVQIDTPLGQQQTVIRFDTAELLVKLPLQARPTAVRLDPEYALMRQLAPAETPPSLAAVLGSPRLLWVANPAQTAIYQPLIDALGVADSQLRTAETLSADEWQVPVLVIAGYDHPLAQQLLGSPPVPSDGVRLRVYAHPYQENGRILLLHSQSVAESSAVAPRLAHYGQYSELAFSSGRNTAQSIQETPAGLLVWEDPPVTAIAVSSSQTRDLAAILPTLASQRIIYVGEQHDQFAHHINQWQIIQALHRSHKKLAIGLEMFQRASQPALDAYLAGRIDERQFLKDSHYFSRWRFDYNLYKPLLDYAKAHGLPVLALNADEALSRRVGAVDIPALTPEERAQLPASLDFTNPDYRRDLQAVFVAHQQHSGYQQSFAQFLQVQVVWDETMADTAHQFLQSHPDTSLVILAGNGHIRHRYGIPARLQRRNGLPYLSLVQDETLQPDIADYVLLSAPLSGDIAPKLGVLLDERDGQLLVMEVSPDTPAAAAGLQKGDVLQQLGEYALTGMDDLKYALFVLGTPKASVPLHLQRGGAVQQFNLKF